MPNTAVAPARVTLAIEGWNADNLESRQLFERTMRSLAAQPYPVDQCEVLILLDEEHANNDTAWLKAFLPSAQIVPVPGTTYFRLKNAALTHASREIIVFADSDVAYVPHWLESLLLCYSKHPGIVVGNTQFDSGFMSRTLSLCEWAATRPTSGWTDWFYGNNVAAPRDLLRKYGFRDDLGPSGGGSVDLLRLRLRQEGTKIWFCAEARGSHNLPPLWSTRLRLAAYQIHFRRAAPESPWGWLVRVPVLGPFLVIFGTLIKAWQRAFRLRKTLPLRGWSLPFYLGSIAAIKVVECGGAAAYAWFPNWLQNRTGWFTVPETTGTAIPGEERHLSEDS